MEIPGTQVMNYERPVQFIDAITDQKDMWKLSVRVKDKWTVVKDGKEHLEMLIVDAKGNDIQVIMASGYKSAFDKILEENSTYTLSNFQMVNNNLLFKASDHKFMLKWTGGTTAEDVNLNDIPTTHIKYKPFAEIVSSKWRPDLLVNVIGVVQDMGYCQLNEGKKLQVNFTMKDLSDIVLHCTLWEEYAAKFIKYNSDRKDVGPVIVLLKYCKIKAEGKYPLSVSNTYSFTRLFINDDIPEINRFKESLPKDDQTMSQSQIMCTQSYSSSQLSSEEHLLSNTTILPLSHVIQLDQITYCLTVATIVKVNATKHGWYYFACHKCPKIAKGDKPPYCCEDGHNTETEIVRYKLEVEVSYEDAKTTFVLWDREVTQLLQGLPAAQLRTNMIQAGITNRLEYPMMLDGMAHTNIVAKVKWQPKWKTCSVVCLKEGSAFVDQVKSKFPRFQQPAPPPIHVGTDAMVDDAPGESDIPTNDVTVTTHDLSASSEYDPEGMTQTTPLSKMKNVEMCSNLETLSQLTPTVLKTLAESTTDKIISIDVPSMPKTHADDTPAKHSSSKRVKLIKQEKK